MPRCKRSRRRQAQLLRCNRTCTRAHPACRLEGRASTDFAQLAPFLDLMLPMGMDLHNIAGTMQATWTVTAPPAASLATAWHEPTAVVSGTAALTLTLPKFAGVGDNLSVRFNGEVTGNAEQLAWTLSKDSRLEVELDRASFPLPPTLQWLLPAKNRHVVLECLEPIKGQLMLTAIPPQFTVEGPIRAQYGAAQAPVQMEVVLRRVAGQGAEHLTAAGTYRLMGASDTDSSRRAGRAASAMGPPGDVCTR